MVRIYTFQVHGLSCLINFLCRACLFFLPSSLSQLVIILLPIKASTGGGTQSNLLFCCLLPSSNCCDQVYKKVLQKKHI